MKEIVCACESEESDRDLNRYSLFLQACNVIKGVIDLVHILPCGCYLFLRHEKRPFCG